MTDQLKCSHLDNPTTIYYYRAPLDKNPRGRVIMENREEIELIVRGHVYCRHMDSVKKLACGHFVWHHPGEKTVNQNDLNNPYECLVLRFSIKEGYRPNRPVRLSYWADTVACRNFVEELLIATNRSSDMALIRDYAYTSFCYAGVSMKQNTCWSIPG